MKVDGRIVVTCEFCSARYGFAEAEIAVRSRNGEAGRGVLKPRAWPCQAAAPDGWEER